MSELWRLTAACVMKSKTDCARRIIYKYESQLIQNVTLKRRYKRFLADVTLTPATDETVVYVPNTGSMLNLVPPQLQDPPCVLSIAPEKSKRKYKYTVEMIQVNQTFVGIHSALANRMVLNALQRNYIPECSGFSDLKQEVTVEEYDDDVTALKQHSSRKQGKGKKKNLSRIDFELLFGNQNCNQSGKNSTHGKRKRCSKFSEDIHVDISQRMLIEVKSVTLAPYERSTELVMAEFPDCVSARAKKHAESLTRHVKNGGRAALIFLIQRDDCNSFTISSIDMAYKEAVRAAKAAGVLVLPYMCRLCPSEATVEIMGKVPFIE